ncbi:MAG: energy-coupling factor ABC transporter ATP-binding protein [Pseudomonadota bacterium]
MLTVDKVAFHYMAATPVLREVSFAAKGGEILALVGRNGAGKSTLLRLLNGLRKPTQGSVVIAGKNTHDTPPHIISHSIGTVFQTPEQQIFNATVRDEVAFGPNNLPLTSEQRDERVTRSLARTRLSDFAKSHPLDLDQAQRRFVALASVLASQPPALLLDEPQRGLDARGRALLAEIIREEQAADRCIIIVCHDMEFVARLATRMIALADGRLSADMAPVAFFSDARAMAEASVEPPDTLRLSAALGLPPSLTPSSFAGHWLARHT